MEVKIGIQSVPRELIVETDTPAEEVERDLAEAIAGSPDGKGAGLFTLAVRNGGKLLIPADKIAYVEFSAAESRRVGFGNIV